MWGFGFFSLPLTLLFLSPAAPAVCPDSLQHKEQEVETKEQHLQRQQKKNNLVNKKNYIYIYFSPNSAPATTGEKQLTNRKMCSCLFRLRIVKWVCGAQTKTIILNLIGFLNSRFEKHRRNPRRAMIKAPAF